MKKSIFFFIAVVFLIMSCERDWNNRYDSLGNWKAKYAFEGLQRCFSSSFVIGNNAYVGFGYNGDIELTTEQYLKDWWVYSPSEDRWRMIQYNPGKGRAGAVAFSLGEKGYVGTGYDGTDYLKDFWEYNPQTNTWIRKDDFPGKIRCGAVSFVLSGYAYVGTGIGMDDAALYEYVDFYRFDPNAENGKQWQKIQSTGGDKRSEATAFTFKDKAYVCTGSHRGYLLNDIWEYHPDKDWWEKKNDLELNTGWSNIPVNASSFVINDRAYVLLGENINPLKEVWEYDFDQDNWNRKADFEGVARSGATAFTIGEKVFVGLGKSGTTYLDDIWEYCPDEKYNDED